MIIESHLYSIALPAISKRDCSSFKNRKRVVETEIATRRVIMYKKNKDSKDVITSVDNFRTHWKIHNFLNVFSVQFIQVIIYLETILPGYKNFKAGQ